MTNTPLTKDLVDRTDLCRLSLIIGRDAIDVLVRRIVGTEPSLTARVALDPATAGEAAAVEEAVYANPLLLAPYGKVDVALRTGRAIVAPAGTGADTVAALAAADPSLAALSSPLDRHNDVVYFTDRALANFISRTYDAVPVHVLSPLVRYFEPRGRDGNTSNMFVELTEGGDMQLIVFNAAGLAAACSCRCLSADDAVYRVLAVFSRAGLDPENDNIAVAGSPELRRPLMESLTPFVRHVLPVIPPAGAFAGDTQALKAPVSLLTLSL